MTRRSNGRDLRRVRGCGGAEGPLGMLALLTLPLAAHGAEWRVAPSARVASSYTDNPRLLLESGGADAGAVGELSADLRRITERLDVSLRPRLRSAHFREDVSLNSDDQFLDASMRGFNERSQWEASASLTRDTTLTSEPGSTGIVQSNRRHESLMLAGGPSFALAERVSAGAQLYWLDSRYPDAGPTGLVDYEYQAASLFTTFAASDRSEWTLTAQGGDLVSSAMQTRDAAVRLKWTYELHPLWTAKLSAGPAYVSTDASSDNGVVFEGDLERRGERWSALISAGRDLSPTGRGVLARRDRASFRLSHRLTEGLAAAVAAQWVMNEDLLAQPGVTLYRVDYGRIDLNLNWRIAERWSIALALGGAAQEVSTRPGRADSYQTSLSIVWNGQPLLL